MASIGDQRVARVAQVVRDLSGDGLRAARVLDLGCDTGNFSFAVARQGAREVIGIEGREAHVRKAIAARDEEGLTQVQFLHDDARTLSRDRHGEFDVVLCLGLLYHLDTPDVFNFARQLASVCCDYALIETQVGLAGKEKVEFDGSVYEGLWYGEDTTQRGASLDNRRSFWPTKPSLLTLLADVGFTSVAEVLQPVIPNLAEYRDHTLLVAIKGTPVQEVRWERWPESLPNMAHPAQSWSYVVRDRLARLSGRGLPSLFR